MTAKRLRELAKEAGYEIRKGFTHSEEGSRKAGQSGYEIINAETSEAITHSACGETWHFAYTLEEVESFLQDVYEQAGMAWEPETGATLEETLSEELGPMIKGFVECIRQKVQEHEEDERLYKKAMELLSIPIDLDNLSTDDLKKEMEKCRELCESISGRVAGVWKEDGLDVNSIRMKLLMIEWILDTPEFGLGAGENLLDLAYAMAKERVLQLEHDAPYAKEEATE